MASREEHELEEEGEEGEADYSSQSMFSAREEHRSMRKKWLSEDEVVLMKAALKLFHDEGETGAPLLTSLHHAVRGLLSFEPTRVEVKVAFGILKRRFERGRLRRRLQKYASKIWGNGSKKNEEVSKLKKKKKKRKKKGDDDGKGDGGGGGIESDGGGGGIESDGGGGGIESEGGDEGIESDGGGGGIESDGGGGGIEGDGGGGGINGEGDDENGGDGEVEHPFLLEALESQPEYAGSRLSSRLSSLSREVAEPLNNGFAELSAQEAKLQLQVMSVRERRLKLTVKLVQTLSKI
ncbi:uncharacterized protein [Typha angustifolia]|uniref:uncharacterized protein n=1 Tax=Typha angustifolia TaxID=59011 RepID=UPI003C2FD61D